MPITNIYTLHDIDVLTEQHKDAARVYHGLRREQADLAARLLAIDDVLATAQIAFEQSGRNLLKAICGS